MADGWRSSDWSGGGSGGWNDGRGWHSGSDGSRRPEKKAKAKAKGGKGQVQKGKGKPQAAPVPGAEAEEEAGACRRRREEERQPMRQEIQELRLRNSALSAENASMASARAEYVEAVAEESAQRTLLRMNTEMFAGQHKMLEKVQSEHSALSEQLAQTEADGDKSFRELEMSKAEHSQQMEKLQAEHRHQVEDLEKRLKLEQDDCSEQIKRGRQWYNKFENLQASKEDRLIQGKTELLCATKAEEEAISARSRAETEKREQEEETERYRRLVTAMEWGIRDATEAQADLRKEVQEEAVAAAEAQARFPLA
ncbi:unnamed protein product [Symbiodinium necroappetens]|uniref:Uncharacterized protein n=1 Tax=Symbiodinium necroappetens TaxID=1628268 RepID=A0A813A148_9DINO|nr:unnamed protein product [Symbiodinium necroappetens]